MKLRKKGYSGIGLIGYDGGLTSRVSILQTDAPSSDQGILIDVDNLTVRQRGRTLIDKVSLQVRRGEIVTIIGPNGSGKSTTIRAILGIIKANAGHVTKLPNLKIGYVPQKLEINWSMPLTVCLLYTSPSPRDS